jgi:hypothetical protein
MASVPFPRWARRSVALATLVLGSLAGCSAPCDREAGRFGRPAIIDGDEAPPAAPCSDGEFEECHVTLGRHNDVLSCYVGARICENGAWGPCSDGVVENRLDPGPDTGGEAEDLDRAHGKAHWKSLGPAQDCTTNPCDPACKEYDESPGADEWKIGGDAYVYEWKQGKLPDDVAAKALQEPCEIGSDCQIDHACHAPGSGSCSHDVCSEGAGLEKGCSKCASAVCAAKPECCEKAYAGSCEHEPCLEGTGLKPSCDPDVASVCADDESCCPHVETKQICKWEKTAYPCKKPYDCWAAKPCEKTYQCGWQDYACTQCGFKCVPTSYACQKSKMACGWKPEHVCGWESQSTCGWKPVVVCGWVPQYWCYFTWWGWGGCYEWGSTYECWTENQYSCWSEPVYVCTWKNTYQCWTEWAWDTCTTTDCGYKCWADTCQAPKYCTYWDECLTWGPYCTSTETCYNDEWLCNTVTTSHPGKWSASCVNAYKKLGGSACPASWPGKWDASCVDAVHDVCGAFCGATEKPSPATPCTYVQAPFVGTTSLPPNGSASDDGKGPAAKLGYVIALRIEPVTGNLLALETNNGGRIRRAAPDGTVTTVVASVAPSGYANLGVDQLGNLYWATSTGIRKRDPSGGFTDLVVQWPKNTYPSALNVGPDGQIYVAYHGVIDGSPGAGIGRVSPAGGAPTWLFESNQAAVGVKLSVVTDLAVDEALNVYLGDVNHGQIVKVTKSGQAVVFKKHSALGIAVGPQGNLYAGGQAFAADGTVLGTGFGGSYGIAVGADGTVFVPRGDYNASWGWAFAIDKYTGCSLNGSGSCLPWQPGETDGDCPGISLTVGPTCASTIPICNHGTATAPAGIALLHLPKDSGAFGLDPPSTLAGGVWCTTTAPIPPGHCVDVTDCPDLSEGREIMVNPPGPGRLAECYGGDNWGIYVAGACGAPTCNGADCPGEFEPAVHSETYEAACEPGELPQWGYFSWDTECPGGSQIEWGIRTAPTESGLGTESYQKLAKAASTPNDTQICAPGGSAGCPIDLFDELGAERAQRRWLELEATLTPNAKKNAAPTIKAWHLTYSCIPE